MLINRSKHVIGIVLGITMLAAMLGSAAGSPFAYIPNSGSNSVSIIDTSSDVRTYTMYYAGNGPWGVAVNPTGTRVYVTNSSSSSVMVIDTATYKIIGSISVGTNPLGIAINPSGTKLYVANHNSNNVSVVDSATNNVIATVPVGSPWGVAVNPTRPEVYVTNNGAGSMSIINTNTNSLADIIPVGSWPAGVAVNPAGTRVYVANNGGGSLSVYDILNHTVATIPNIGNYPFGVAVNSAGTKVYVTHYWLYYGNSVSVIDTATNSIITSVTVGNGPAGIDINPAGTKVYVANHNSNNVSVIDTATNNVTTSISVENGPIALGKFIAPSTSTSITVKSPNGGEIWQAGTSHAIQWTYSGNPGTNLNITLLKSGLFNSIINQSVNMGTSGSGSYNWNIPTTQTSGNDYKVKITSIGNPSYTDSSNANFTISGPTICNVSTIYGYSFNDSNANKTKDPGEAGLSNWTINLNGYDTCKGTLVSTTTKTNSTGYYAFKVNPGVYVSSQNFVIGWLPTTDAAYTLAIPSKSTSIRKDFGNHKLS